MPPPVLVPPVLVPPHVDSSAVPFAIIGGLLWGVGTLGRRYGVAGAPDELQQARSAYTIFVYNLSVLLIPAANLAYRGLSPMAEVFNRSEFSTRLPVIVVFGILSGFGGIASTQALALATPDGSALITMVQNGVYTLMAGFYIAAVYREELTLTSCSAAVLIISGVLLADAKSFRCGSVTTLSRPKAGKSNVPAVCLSVAAGCLWGFGPLGKRYGVQDATDENKAFLSTITVFSLVLCAVVASALNLCRDCSVGFVTAFGERDVWYRVLAIAVSGTLAGLGGILCTYAFTQAKSSETALIATLENGVFTVAAATYITVAFREKPTMLQLGSAALVLAGILTVGL